MNTAVASARQQQAWITGAGTGIGRELARQLAQLDYRVFVSARSHAALHALVALHPDNIVAITADVTDPQSVQQAVATIQQYTPALDLVVLNAGTCEYVNNGVIDNDSVQRVLATNFTGAVYCAQAVLPLLESATHPALYVVSSQVTRLPITRSEAYGASKAALEYFFRSLRIDWQPRGIHIGIIRPGFVKTPLTDKNDFAMPGIWCAERAAQTMLRGIHKRKLEIAFPWRLSLTLALLASLPASAWLYLSRNMVRNHDPHA